jgi:hypothetical protein
MVGALPRFGDKRYLENVKPPLAQSQNQDNADSSYNQ